MYSRHEEYARPVSGKAELVFEHLDDQVRLSAHMSKRSWKMGWGRMNIRLDDGRGRIVGSRMALEGRVFGFRLFLEEVVTERLPPFRKSWETIGQPRLLVIGPYRMGFELVPRGSTSHLKVAIDYELPRSGLSRLLGLLFGRSYAKWCTKRMVLDAQLALEGAR